MDFKKNKKSIKVLIEYHIKEDNVTVKSEFENSEKTLKLIQLGLEEWINKHIGYTCPHCDEQIDKNWEFCSFCGGKIE